MVKAFSYIRFSTPEQARGDSLRRQLEGARLWCAEHGLELDDSLRDLGRSAFKGKHAEFGALRRFLDFVEDGTVPRGSHLLVESFDRLSRETVLDAAARLFDLVRSGIVVVTLSDGQVYSEERLRNDWTPLIISITIMARAHEESRTKGLRVGKAWEEKRRRASQDGQAMTSIAPGWLRLVGGPRRGHYELIDERAAIVRRIFADTIAGLGRRSITKALNEAGIEPWGLGKKRGERWHDSYVQKILGSPATYGEFESLGLRAGGDGAGAVMIADYFPPVIDKETFYRAQASSKKRSAGSGRPSDTHRNLLRGLAKCGTCGSNMVIVDKGARSSGPKLICGRAHAGAGCDHRRYYRYALLEVGVIHCVADRKDSLIASALDKSGSLRADRGSLSARHDDLTGRLENLVAMVEAGGAVPTVLARVTQLQVDIEGAAAAIEVIDREIKEAEITSSVAGDKDLLAVYKQFDGLEGDELKRIRALAHQRLSALVDRVDIEPGLATVRTADGGIGRIEGALSAM